MLSIPDWIAGLVLVLVLLLFARFVWHQSFGYQYRDIIAKSRNEANYYLVGRSKSRDFTPEQRKEIYARDKGICQVTGKPTKNAPKNFRQKLIYFWSHLPGFGFLWLNDLAEIDHIIPNSWNGPKELWNGRVTRRIINRKRSNKLDKDVFELVRKRKEKIYLGRRK